MLTLSGHEDAVRCLSYSPDGKTIRPIPGMEDRFANFCKQFREENAEVAKKYVFEGVQEDPK